jgi:predicted GTPase
MTFQCIILGAAGRDFHNFLTFFRANPQFRVCAFTAAQIPFIEQRVFPASLIGVPGAQDIPIFPEAELRELIARYRAEFVFLAYSDLSHAEVMHKAAVVQACGASFALLGPRHTQLHSTRPVISVTAVRTGAGKSPLTRRIAQTLQKVGRRVVVLRHPMPYGDLEQQRVQRFATVADLDRHNCTIEEREEFEPYVELGLTVYAGVDYAEILKSAEAESDVILWDGGNNDFSFLAPGLSLVVADALRPGHETAYFPGETNFRSADVIVINKVSQASPGDVQVIRDHAQALNPNAVVMESDLGLAVEDERAILGKRVLVVEDGPTLTHGGMSFGAGLVAAKRAGAAEMLDPRPFAVGSIADCYRSYPHIGPVLPALGYSREQRVELEQTIRASGAEVVVDASPARLSRCIDVGVPVARVSYEFHQLSGKPLESLVERFLEGHKAGNAQ